MFLIGIAPDERTGNTIAIRVKIEGQVARLIGGSVGTSSAEALSALGGFSDAKITVAIPPDAYTTHTLTIPRNVHTHHEVNLMMHETVGIDAPGRPRRVAVKRVSPTLLYGVLTNASATDAALAPLKEPRAVTTGHAWHALRYDAVLDLRPTLSAALYLSTPADAPLVIRVPIGKSAADTLLVAIRDARGKYGATVGTHIAIAGDHDEKAGIAAALTAFGIDVSDVIIDGYHDPIWAVAYGAAIAGANL